MCLPLAVGGFSAADDRTLAANTQPLDVAVPNPKMCRITGKRGVGGTALTKESPSLEGTAAAQLDPEVAKVLEYVGVMAWPADDAWMTIPSRLQRGLAWDKVEAHGVIQCCSYLHAFAYRI